MQLSRESLRQIIPVNGLIKSPDSVFLLPEKVLQFGTGVLLRGIPDYFIDKANRQGVFNGRIVAVNSSSPGAVDVFNRQDNLYTVCVKGLDKGEVVEETIIHSAISRVLSAQTQWNEVLKCAANPDLQVVISNTNEFGLVMDTEDDMHASPPGSFTGKLLAFLYRRYRVFQGDPSKGLVIIPMELIPDNGERLESIIEELAHENNLEYAFMDWLENANYFCNSVVDRIVHGNLPPHTLNRATEEFGYRDELMILSEPYRFWAIESANPKVKEILSFRLADEGILISPDIGFYRDLKLHLLNGSHTFSCGLAFLAGFETVKEAMSDGDFSTFISNLVHEEIGPAIIQEGLSPELMEDFFKKALDRYSNPSIGPRWLDIAAQYVSKLKMCCLPVMLNYLSRYGNVPKHMTLAIAAHLLFMKCKKSADGKYYGELNGKKYPVFDDNIVIYSHAWEHGADSDAVVEEILRDTSIWDPDLAGHEVFLKTIKRTLQGLSNEGAWTEIRKLIRSRKMEEVS